MTDLRIWQMLELDAYIERNKLGNACVTHVFDRKVHPCVHLKGRVSLVMTAACVHTMLLTGG